LAESGGVAGSAVSLRASLSANPLCSQEQLKSVPLLVQNNILAACFECHQPRAVFFFFNNFNFAKLAKVLLKMKLFTANQNTFPSFSESEFQSILLHYFSLCR